MLNALLQFKSFYVDLLVQIMLAHNFNTNLFHMYGFLFAHLMNAVAYEIVHFYH